FSSTSSLAVPSPSTTPFLPVRGGSEHEREARAAGVGRVHGVTGAGRAGRAHRADRVRADPTRLRRAPAHRRSAVPPRGEQRVPADRKSTRLNSSHVSISYAV